MGVGGYNLSSGGTRWLLAIGIPTGGAVVWGVFNVPGDRSRSGQAPVVVPGALRIAIELAFFAVGVILLWRVAPVPAAFLGIGLLIHYLLSLDRIRWLVGN